MACCRATSFIFLLLISTLIIFTDGTEGQDTFKSASVYCKKKQCTHVMNKLDWKSATAVATFNDTLMSSGWGILDISSGYNQNATSQDNEDIMYASGFVEGLLTAKHMETQYTNLYNVFFSKPNPVLLKKLKKWFETQRDWADSMIAVHKGSSALWRHVSYILSQLDGLFDGYSHASNKGTLDMFAVNYLQANGDLLDLLTTLNPSLAADWTKFTPAQARRYFYTRNHCSALIKVLPGFENIFMSHSSWFSYMATNRIFKHYNFNVNDPATAAKRLSFSSYAGYLESLDDFYMLGSGMVMLQTTNGILDTSVYSLVTVNSLFAWQRVRIANMMAHGGEEWTQILAQYNSGTYNNQYMVIDLKKVKLKLPLPNNTLWVAEQMPGLVVAKDLTPILREGYFSSYNVPFFEEVFNKSGYPAYVKKHGLSYSYQLAPRAKIFRRDQGSVTDMESMKKIMRYNDYKTDPYSEGSPWNSICSRGDLDPSFPEPDGCYDTKVTDFDMARAFQADIVNGPTLGDGLKPFSWTPFQNYSHVGLPNIYNFSFIRTQPSLERP